MPFDPRSLPPGVQAAFRQGALAWPLVLQKALDATIFNLNKLTDIIFYLHHPERIGRPLQPHETKLINQWKGFRTMITPSVRARTSEFYRIFDGTEGTDVPGF
jgi:hypothetical protein